VAARGPNNRGTLSSEGPGLIRKAGTRHAGSHAPYVDVARDYATLQSQPAPTAQAPTQPQGGQPRPTQLPAQQELPAVSRDAALEKSPRILIQTPRIKGSVALTGGRIDDVSLTDYHECTR
jgi:YidC/Oxa1 family membrane protein insertase